SERRVRVVPVTWGTGEGLVVSWDGETFSINGEAAADGVVLSRLDALTEEGHQVVLRAREAFRASGALRLTVVRGSSDQASVLAVEPRDASGAAGGPRPSASPGLTAAVE